MTSTMTGDEESIEVAMLQNLRDDEDEDSRQAAAPSKRRTYFYIASIVVKIISVIAATACITLVTCMEIDEDEQTEDFVSILGHSSENAGLVTIVLDIIAFPLMAAVKDYGRFSKMTFSKPSGPFAWLKVTSWVLFFVFLGYGQYLLLFADDVSSFMVTQYSGGAAIAWIMMLLYVEWTTTGRG